MPNTGRPSRGCQECKDRKVKVRLQPPSDLKLLTSQPSQCDQAVPACHRCSRNDRRCPGYPSQSDVIFRNRFSLAGGGSNGPSSNRRLGDGMQQSLLPSPISTDWRQQAIAMFFHDYIIGSKESKIDFGYLQDLPDVLSRAGDSSALSEAVSAVALTNLAHRSSLPYLKSAGRQAYGRSLGLFNAVLREDTDVCSDQTLATVLCLDFYEVSSTFHWLSPC